MTCENCGKELRKPKRGPQPKTCSTRCRVALHRARKSAPFPLEMLRRDSWVRADGKRPIQPSGVPASSTNPTTWTSYSEALRGAGDGMGFMLGGGVGCYDLDDVTDTQARRIIRTIPEPIVFCERSMSGRGVHVFVQASEGRGMRHGNLERYTCARFIRTTGVKFPM